MFEHIQLDNETLKSLGVVIGSIIAALTATMVASIKGSKRAPSEVGNPQPVPELEAFKVTVAEIRHVRDLLGEMKGQVDGIHKLLDTAADDNIERHQRIEKRLENMDERLIATGHNVAAIKGVVRFMSPMKD